MSSKKPFVKLRNSNPPPIPLLIRSDKPLYYYVVLEEDQISATVAFAKSPLNLNGESPNVFHSKPKWFDKYSVLFLLSKLSLQLSTCLTLKQLLSRREQGTFSKEPTQKHSFRNRVSRRIEPLYPQKKDIHLIRKIIAIT